MAKSFSLSTADVTTAMPSVLPSNFFKQLSACVDSQERADSYCNFSLDDGNSQAAIGFKMAELGRQLGAHRPYLTTFE